ncbi:MAG: response regulator [Deferrisomatales bacterium]
MAHVLLIDDDEGIRFLVKEELTLEGHEVRTAADGWQGLRAVAESAPDVVILDVKMPGLGGLEVLRRLKAADPRLPVFLFTAYSDYADAAQEHGADGYFVKSADLSRVKRAVRDAANGASAHRPR